MGRSLVQRSPTECGVSEYDHAVSTMRSLGSLGLSSLEEINRFHKSRKFFTCRLLYIKPLQICLCCYLFGIWLWCRNRNYKKEFLRHTVLWRASRTLRRPTPPSDLHHSSSQCCIFHHCMQHYDIPSESCWSGPLTGVPLAHTHTLLVCDRRQLKSPSP